MQNQQVEAYLKAAQNSDVFRTSKTSRELLGYLVHCSLKNETPKEVTIAIDFFGKDSSYDSAADSSVRSQIHQLRKKLAIYYQNEGKENAIQFVIPKGHYKVNFIKKRKKPGIRALFILLIIAQFFLIVLWFLSAKFIIPSHTAFPVFQADQKLWHEFVAGDKPTLLVIGDHYFYLGQSATNESSAIRDFAINSNEDLDEFLKNNPDAIRTITKTDHTYLTKRIPWAMQTILPSFVMHDRHIEIKLASEIQGDDLQKYNIVYVGAFRSLGTLWRIIESLPFSYDMEKGVLNFQDSLSNTASSYDAGSCSDFQIKMNDARDYAMVIKTNGPNQNRILFFLSTHDIGTISTVRHFTNESSLSQFTEQYLPAESDQNFFVLFDVRGIARTDFEIDLLRFGLITGSMALK